MKKILALMCCSLLLVGCNNREQKLNHYILENESNYNEEYDTQNFYKQNLEPWQHLKTAIYTEGLKISDTWEENGEINEGSNYNMITLWDVDSKVGKALVKVISSYVGDEIEEVIEKAKKEKPIKEVDSEWESGAVQEHVIGEYGVICNNQEGKVSLRLIKSNLQVTNSELETLLNEGLKNKFMLNGIYAGKDNQMLEVATPMFIRNNYGYNGYSREENSAYTQVFTQNKGEVYKVRMVINKHTEQEIDENYINQLQLLVSKFTENNTDIDTLKTDLQRVYTEEKQVLNGKIDTMNYKIARYTLKNHQRGELVEIILQRK